MPEVSILLPVRNGGSFIDQAVKSLQAQSFTDFELICVDDQSTDETRQKIVAAREQDPRVRLVDGPGKGLVAALEAGLAVATGRLVARQDADDASRESRLAAQVGLLDAENAVLVGCGWTVHNQSVGAGVAATVTPPQRHEELMRRALVRTPFPGGTQVMDRAALGRAGGFGARRHLADDYDLFARMAVVGRVAADSRPLYLKTSHPSNLSRRSRDEQFKDSLEVQQNLWRRNPPEVWSRSRINAALGSAAFDEVGQRRRAGILLTELLIVRHRISLRERGAALAQLAVLGTLSPAVWLPLARDLPERWGQTRENSHNSA